MFALYTLTLFSQRVALIFSTVPNLCPRWRSGQGFMKSCCPDPTERLLLRRGGRRPILAFASAFAAATAAVDVEEEEEEEEEEEAVVTVAAVAAASGGEPGVALGASLHTGFPEVDDCEGAGAADGCEGEEGSGTLSVLLSEAVRTREEMGRSVRRPAVHVLNSSDVVQIISTERSGEMIEKERCA